MEAIGDAPRPNLTPADYSIGWICTKDIDYDAAQLFLDEMHPNIVLSNRNHHYTLGKMGQHNVVIAALANRDCEEKTVAILINDMKHDFLNISINLMVGIGSGAPSSEHDIRLGDVVVSTPCNGNSGVFEYDFYQTVQDGTLHTTGRFINQPPRLLMASVARLRGSHQLNGHQIKETISSILEKEPRLRQKYGRPQSSSDRLYKSTVNRPSNTEEEEGRIISRGNDVSLLVQRPKRSQYEDNPCIHYGLIASGSQIMRDAIIRDKLISENKDIVCFDTEPARVLMGSVSGLVVRGICDYSDSHKNEEWKGYAAMTAAAFAKDLVRSIHTSARF